MVPRSARSGPILSPALARHLRAAFRLDWGGIHGGSHWARVRINGLVLAARTGASTRVVEIFAFLHDARRQDEGRDARHGARAAALAAELGERFFALGHEERALLAWACRDHSDGLLDADVTVQTCWDADRLDLGRIGIRPDPDRLCTAAARERATIEAAVRRSRAWRERWRG